MILAGEVAALWCSQRGIPLFYRGTQVNPELPPPLVYKRDILDPGTAKLGHPPYLAARRYTKLVGKAVNSAEPTRHSTIGTNAYSKVTSPLRRYSDMVAHWQIESVLRHEAESGKSLVGTRDDRYLAFSRAQIEEMIPHIVSREQWIAAAKQASNLHWITLFLARGFYFNEIELPKTWSVFVVRTYVKTRASAARLQAIIKELNTSCYVEENEASQKLGGVEVGDWWEAKIKAIDTFRRTIHMEPIRLIEKTPSWA